MKVTLHCPNRRIVWSAEAELTGVVGANAGEVVLGDGEKAAGHGGRPDGRVVVLAGAVLGLGQRVPREDHVPVEAAHAHLA